MRHLFIALSTKGFGETTLGLRVARELHAAGDECVFLVHSSSASLLQRTPFEYMKSSDHTIGLLKLMLMTLFAQQQPASIILSDCFTTALAFDRAGLEPNTLKEEGIPIGAIDTWDMERSGTVIDAFGGEQRTFSDWSGILDYRLTPVPIANPDSTGRYYANLPEPAQISQKVRRHVRRSVGIPSDAKLILFCTAEWQHATFRSDHGNRLARLLPQLIGHYVHKLGGHVHLAHVGPAAYSLDLGAQYHWLPPLPPDKFEALLASSDLLLVANISSTTIAKALVTGVPSAVLVNSYALGTVDDLPTGRGEAATKELMAWVKDAAPLYPFYMWPLGYYEFLKPLLDGNPYCQVVPMLEMLHETDTLDTLSSLLDDRATRDRVIERQLAYVSELGQLPSGGELVSRALSGQARC